MDNNIYSTILVNFRSKTKQLPINILWFDSIHFVSIQSLVNSLFPFNLRVFENWGKIGDNCYYFNQSEFVCICPLSEIDNLLWFGASGELSKYNFCIRGVRIFCCCIFFFWEIIMRKMQWPFQFPSKSLLSSILKKISIRTTYVKICRHKTMNKKKDREERRKISDSWQSYTQWKPFLKIETILLRGGVVLTTTTPPPNKKKVSRNSFVTGLESVTISIYPNFYHC